VKWFFLLCFAAGVVYAIFWTVLLVFVIATARFRGMTWRGPALLIPLVFFVWGAREMFLSFERSGLDS